MKGICWYNALACVSSITDELGIACVALQIVVARDALAGLDAAILAQEPLLGQVPSLQRQAMLLLEVAAVRQARQARPAGIDHDICFFYRLFDPRDIHALCLWSEVGGTVAGWPAQPRGSDLIHNVPHTTAGVLATAFEANGPEIRRHVERHITVVVFGTAGLAVCTPGVAIDTAPVVVRGTVQVGADVIQIAHIHHAHV